MLRFTIRGLTPFLSHNGQMADPQNEWTRALKTATLKKKKTDRDYDEIARIEFMGGLYVNDKGEPCMPGENIEAMILAEAGRNKMKREVKAGVISDGLFPIIYDGPRNAEKLWLRRKDFAFSKTIRNQMSRVVRTRPIFREWSLVFDVEVIEEVINRSRVEEFVRAAGGVIGLGDWRPKFGRFELESVEEVN